MKKDIISKRKGFTIIELVVVIVVIAILTTITGIALIVVPQRAYDTKAEAAAKNVKDLVDLYRSVNGSYPEAASVPLTAFLDYAPENYPENVDFIEDATDPARNSTNSQLKYCVYPQGVGVTRTGYIIEYFSGSSVKTKRGGDTTNIEDCASYAGIAIFDDAI